MDTSTPCDTLIDDTLVSIAMQDMNGDLIDMDKIQDIAVLFGDNTSNLLERYKVMREFTPLHEALLDLNSSRIPVEDRLASLFKVQEVPDIDKPDANGRSALAWAAEYGWPRAVKALLHHGADPTQMRACRLGRSPLLHLTIASPPCPRFDIDFVEVVRLLVSAGADINATDHDGWTPLHVAASWGLASVIKVLVELGGNELDMGAQTNDGESALDLAQLDGGQHEVLCLLKMMPPPKVSETEGGAGRSCKPSGIPFSQVNLKLQRDSDVEYIEETFVEVSSSFPVE